MSTDTAPRLQARTRWSAAAKCPRWAALGGLGAEPAEPEERTKRIFARGKMFGWFVAEQLAAKHGEENIVREKEVPWLAGVLHTDVYVKPERLAVEVKSTTAPDSMLADALLQLAGEVVYDEEADSGLLVLLDPVDLDEQFIPLALSQEMRDRVEERASLVARALQTNGEDMPDCVCATPGACRSKGCPFTDVAWEGWQAPPPLEMTAELEKGLIELYNADRERKSAKGVYDEADGRFRTLAIELLDQGIEPGSEYAGEFLSVKASSFPDVERMALSKAKKAGCWLPEHEHQFAPFISRSGAHTRWSFRRLTDERLPDDFGDEAPF